MQLKILWEEILKRFPVIEVIGPPTRLLSNFVRGISRTAGAHPGLNKYVMSELSRQVNQYSSRNQKEPTDVKTVSSASADIAFWEMASRVPVSNQETDRCSSSAWTSDSAFSMTSWHGSRR